MKETSLKNLLSFLNRLNGKKISYSLEHNSNNAIMVIVVVPGQRWEVEFFDDGSIEVDRFISTGEIEDESILKDLFEKFSE
ncbi:MAG: hypothetical protein HY805_08260 [Nitrospirae bacterium]|nr:hypothetical protein [Nitrospirota bacterium]